MMRGQSVGLQTLAFVTEAKRLGVSQCATVRHQGMVVTLEYEPEIQMPEGDVVRGVLAIRYVYLPPALRRKGWFRAYITLCESLADEAVFVDVYAASMRDVLMRRGFVQVLKNVFVKRTASAVAGNK